MFFKILGIVSALIFLACDIPYLLDTIKGKIKPHRVTWGVVSIVNSIGFANQLASGATDSLWLFGAAAGMTTLIFLASIKKGTGGHSQNDIIALAASFVGIGLWIVFDSPLLSIFANVFVATISLLPTYAKARKQPETENRLAWLGGTLACILTSISVGSLNWQLLILPISGALLQVYLVYILYFEVKTKKHSSTVDLEEAKRNIL